MSYATVKSSIEARFLLAMLVVLVAFAVPASAAAFGSATAPVAGSDAAAAASDLLPAHGAGVPLLQNTPPPLLVMLVGALIVAGTVVRRMRKSSVRVPASRGRGPRITLR